MVTSAHSPFEPLEGPRLILRDPLERDLKSFRRWQLPRGHAWQKLDGPYYPALEEAEVEERIEALRERIQAGDWPEPRFNLFIVDRETDALLGSVSRYWISKETHWPAAGITLFDPDSWGQGLGFEALGLWTDYVFRTMPEIVRLDLRTWSGNVGMCKLAEKLGYLEEARFRKARIVDGLYYDGLGYGLLREDWQAQYPAGFAASLSG